MADLFRSVPDSTPLRATYRETLDSPGPARHWLAGLLTAEGVDRQTLDDATLVVSELVTNALIHGGGSPTLHMTLTSDALMIVVTDKVDVAEVDELRSGARFPSEVGGLGLLIVERLALAWGVVPHRAGKTVWAIVCRH
jgi:anti-sigma regulatory factor (Ser/Thr protein kinase)